MVFVLLGVERGEDRVGHVAHLLLLLFVLILLKFKLELSLCLEDDTALVV